MMAGFFCLCAAQKTDQGEDLIHRLAIVGLGLIGGSLALAWKERRGDLTLVGYDAPDVLRAAADRGMIDEAAPSLSEAVANVDAVVLSVPLSAMEQVLRDLAGALRPDALVTDVGSVKGPIMAAASRALSDANPFIGGHPMAGAEAGGLSNADAFLFENATYVLCRDGSSHERAYQSLVEIVEATGAHVLALDAARHDRIAACVSHLPQLLATTLMNIVAHQSQDDDAYLRLAAGGFRDMTRIASSPFNLWRSILEANTEALHAILADFQEAIEQVTEAVGRKEVDSLEHAFERARRVRETIPKDFKGFLVPLADVYVYAQDRPGVLAHITGTLFIRGINIKDIELLKIREGSGGAFRLSFSDEPAAEAAVIALENAGCRAHRLN